MMFPLIPKCGQLLAPLALAATLPVKAMSHREVGRIVSPSDIKAGDVIGFSGNSWISGLINIGTYGIPFWGISHVGIMAHAADGRLLIFESTTLEDMPCEIAGECFNGTRRTRSTRFSRLTTARCGIIRFPGRFTTVKTNG